MKLNITDRMTQVASSNLVSSIYKEGGSAYFVGGCVRDLLRGEVPNDIDIVVCSLTEEQLSDIIAKYYPSAELVGKSFGVYKCDDLDIAHARIDRQAGSKHTDIKVNIDPSITLEEDLRRRDFTINAIAIEISDLQLHDPFNGIRDIRQGIIRMVDPEAFADDPLRIVRAFQFKSRFGYRLSPNTETCIRTHKSELRYLPGERLLEELKKVFEKGDPEQFIHDTESIFNYYGIERKYPIIFEDMLYQMFGDYGKRELDTKLKLDSYTASAINTLHNSRYECEYTMLPYVSRRFAHLFKSAYLPAELKELNSLCVKHKVPRNLVELKEFENIDGTYFNVEATHIGNMLRAELRKRQEEIYERYST
jgi:hypothetical protein